MEHQPVNFLDSRRDTHPEAFAEPGVPPAFSHRDPAFTPGLVGDSTLAIELDAHFLRLATTQAGQLRLLEEFTLGNPAAEEPTLHDVRHLMSSHDVLTQNFWQSVRIVLGNQSFTLIPQALFRKEYAMRYLELARGASLSGEKVHHSLHPEWGAVLVFSLPARLDDWLLGMYPFEDLRLSHQLDALLNLACVATLAEGKNALLMLEKQSASLVLLEGGSGPGRLQYANRFAFKTLPDLAYYVVFVLNELKISPQEIAVQAWGHIQPDDPTHAELARYLPNLRVGEAPLRVVVSADFSPTNYAALLNAATA